MDSDRLNTFDDTDRLYLEQLTTILSDAYSALHSPVRDIYLAGGCFWGTQHYLSLLRGVLHAEAGYANGNIPNPTYEQVYTDTTGFAETVHVRYDSSLISLPRLLEMFFKTIDPTSLNRQAHDVGTRYRTGIYFTDPDDLPVIRHSLKKLANNYSDPLVVEVTPLTAFYLAEEYHQDYLTKNPDGYCHIPLDLFAEARNFNP
ncbi:MAG: peptide-methionine (S)-S-oxide reductase MsrA [Bacteroidales bacterium]|nr:peptide-methionine (S)-S-oxide reductase MsrA [Bacteroidales bacterium]